MNFDFEISILHYVSIRFDVNCYTLKRRDCILASFLDVDQNLKDKKETHTVGFSIYMFFSYFIYTVL